MEKRVVHPERFLYKGDPKTDDIALLEISEDKIIGWDTLLDRKGRLAAVPKEPNPANPLMGQVWVYDSKSYYPANSKTPVLSAEGRLATCTLSRTVPLVAADDRGTGSKKWSMPGSTFNEHRIYLDACTDYIYQGNSGGVITDLLVTEVFGIIDSFASVSPLPFYFGNRKRWVPIEGNLNRFFVFGYSLENVNAL